MEKNEVKEMLWNRETGVISSNGDVSFNDFVGTEDEFTKLYETVNVKIQETAEGYFLEGTSVKGQPVYAKLTDEEFFSGKEFVSEFDKKRKKEEVRELYSEVFHARSYVHYSYAAEEYSGLVSSIKKGKLLSIEDVKDIEKEVEDAFDRNKKIEQIKGFYSEIIWAPDYEMTTNLEEDYSRIVELAVKNNLLSREDIKNIETELNKEHQSQQIRESYNEALHEGNDEDFLVILDSVRKEKNLSEKEISTIMEELEREFYTRGFHTEIKQHGKELLQVIDENLLGSEQGKTYIKRDKLEELLDNHFIEVEKLMSTHFEPQVSHNQFIEKAKQLPDKLREMRTDLANQITTTINMTKDFADEKVNQFRDNMDDVVKSTKNFVKRGILNVNSRIQAFTNSIEQNFAVDVEKTNDLEKKAIHDVKNKELPKKTKKNMER